MNPSTRSNSLTLYVNLHSSVYAATGVTATKENRLTLVTARLLDCTATLTRYKREQCDEREMNPKTGDRACSHTDSKSSFSNNFTQN